MHLCHFVRRHADVRGNGHLICFRSRRCISSCIRCILCNRYDMTKLSRTYLTGSCEWSSIGLGVPPAPEVGEKQTVTLNDENMLQKSEYLSRAWWPVGPVSLNS